MRMMEMLLLRSEDTCWDCGWKRYCTISMGCKIMNITLLKRIYFQIACLNRSLKDDVELTSRNMRSCAAFRD
jgi:hypothetical protein